MSHPAAATRRSIITVLLAASLLLSRAALGEQQCPTLAAQAAGGDETPLDLSHFSAYVILNTTSDAPASGIGSGSGLGGSLVELIIPGGEVTPTFSSASSAAELDISFPESNTLLPILLQLNSTAPESVYYLLNIWSLNSTIAPRGCPTVKEGQLSPGDEFMNRIYLSCVREGGVVVQGCLTLGTAPFATLRGTYKTVEFYFLHRCKGFTDSSKMCEEVRAQSSVVPGEMCLTLNQSQQIVTNPVGSWGVLLSPLRPNQEDPLRGYCVIDKSVVGGLATFAADPALRPMFPIAELFSDLEMYLGIVSGAKVLAFSILFTSTNTSILQPPYIVPITAGVAVEKETLIYLNLPCAGPGFVEVLAVINMSTILNETLYFQSYVSSIFKNCTPNKTGDANSSSSPESSSTNSLRLRLLAGMLPGLLLLLITMTAILVMILLTRRIIRRGNVTLQRLESMDNLSGNNAYTLKTLKSPFDCLKELDMEYNYPSLEVVSELGEGAFGRVFKATAPGLEQQGLVPDFVAVKTLKDASTMSEEFCKEVTAVAKFNHPNIVRLLGICSTSAQKCMIFEYMDLGSLDNLLRKSDPENAAVEDDSKREGGDILITPSEFLNLSLQVAHGVAYLAELKYVHRDIASRNCLVNSKLVIKIGDFGLSRDISSMDYYRIGGTQACLPVRWMPPEALLFGKFTTQSDVWSFGVLMWEIYTFGHQPYTGLSNYEVIDAIKASRILECPRLCPASVYDIMKICWTRSPLKRPNMDVVVARLERLMPPGAQGEREGGRQGANGCVVYINLEYGAQVDWEELKESARVEKELSRDKTSEEEGLANAGSEVPTSGDGEARSENHALQNSEDREVGEGKTQNEEATIGISEPTVEGYLQAAGDGKILPGDSASPAQDSREVDHQNEDEMTNIISNTHT